MSRFNTLILFTAGIASSAFAQDNFKSQTVQSQTLAPAATTNNGPTSSFVSPPVVRSNPTPAPAAKVDSNDQNVLQKLLPLMGGDSSLGSSGALSDTSSGAFGGSSYNDNSGINYANPAVPAAPLAPNVNYGNSTCGNITVNCFTHRITMSNVPLSDADQIIDCGKPPATKNGIGMVGGHTSGAVVKRGVDIKIPGMGTSAGGKWFHTAWWNPGERPTGRDSSRGCIHVCPAVLVKLESCENSPLEILNAREGGKSPPGFPNQDSNSSSGIR